MDNHELIISETPEGFVAAATSAPYFCLVGSSEEDVKQRASRALAFYRRVHSAPMAKPFAPPIFALTRLVPSSRVASRELAVA